MSLQTVGLKTSIWNNNLRSLALLALYPLFFAAILWGAAALFGAAGLTQALCLDFTDPRCTGTGGGNPLENGVATANAVLIRYWPAVGILVTVWFMICWFCHTRMVRSLCHSRPVTRTEEPELYNLLENLCISRGMKTPRIEIIETQERNAFASGVDESSYAITVTRGLLQVLQKDELEAVLGHELTHIINRDVRLLIVSVIFTGMIGFIAQAFWDITWRSMMRDRRKKDARVVLLMAAVGGLLWLGYMATIFTRFALSRRREFMADAGSVELTKNPEAMMRALIRIAGRDRIPGAAADVALMCIENSRPFMGLFATHPPIVKRIAAISEATGAPVPDTAPG